MKTLLLRTLVSSVAALLLMGSAQSFAGPYQNTKYRVNIESSGNGNGMWHVTGALGETYNAGDGSYIVCSYANFTTTCAAYDARTGVAVSCSLPRPAPPASVAKCGSADTNCRETTNTVLSAVNNGWVAGDRTKDFVGLSPDSYLDFWVDSSANCSGFTIIKGGYISPVVQ